MTKHDDWKPKATELLRKGGLSQAAIAKECGVNPAQISRFRKRMQAEDKAGIPVPDNVPANQRESYRQAAMNALTVQERILHWRGLLASDNEGVRIKALEKLDELAELVNVQEAPALVPLFALPPGTKLPFGPPPDTEGGE